MQSLTEHGIRSGVHVVGLLRWGSVPPAGRYLMNRFSDHVAGFSVCVMSFLTAIMLGFFVRELVLAVIR